MVQNIRLCTFRVQGLRPYITEQKSPKKENQLVILGIDFEDFLGHRPIFGDC